MQLVRDLGSDNLENRALQDQSKYHDTKVCSLQQREVSRVTTIHTLEDELRAMRLTIMEQEEYLGVMRFQLDDKEAMVTLRLQMANLSFN